jgi:hypothetical protein
MARVGTDAWFGEIEGWLRELLARLPQSPEAQRSNLLALIDEIERVRMVSGRLRVVRCAHDPL